MHILHLQQSTNIRVSNFQAHRIRIASWVEDASHTTAEVEVSEYSACWWNAVAAFITVVNTSDTVTSLTYSGTRYISY